MLKSQAPPPNQPFALSVNLDYMFKEAGPELTERVAAAARAGFTLAEIFMLGDRDVAAFGTALRDHGIELWTLVADPRTRLVDPATHDGFLDLFRRTAEDACTLGCRRIVVGSGPAVPYQKRPVQLQTVTRAVRAAADIAEELNLTILLEAVNTRMDHPGVLFSQTSDTLAVLEGVGSPHVRLLFDIYHAIVEGEKPEEVLPAIAGLVEHVHIADAPGRGEPGSGHIDWPRQLRLLRDIGYAGAIGIECEPTKSSTADALQYIRDLCATV